MNTAGVQRRCSVCKEWLDTLSVYTTSDGDGNYYHESCKNKK